MTKGEAQQMIDALGLPAVQAGAAHRTISRATTTETIEIDHSSTGDLVFKRSRPGRTGHQVFEDTISPDGRKEVVQKAYDAAGNLIHHDPK